MACFNDCAKLQPASNMDLAAPLLVLWVPSPSAFSHPKRLAALPSLSVKLSPVSAGPGCSPVRARRGAFSQKGHTEQDSCGTRISNDPFGYLAQKRLRAILEPPAKCFLLRSFSTAAALSAESSSIIQRCSCLTNGGHSDWARSKNAQLTHTARTSASDGGFLSEILEIRL